MKQLEQGIILAGVHQWRPSIFEGWIPRTLIPIANRPLVDYGLDWFQRGGLQRVEICANSDTHALRENLQPQTGAPSIQIEFYEDVFPRGPAGCVADALRDAIYEDVVVLDGTVIPTQVELDRLIQAHLQSGAVLTVAAIDPYATREAHRSEKDRNASVCVPTGIYVFNRAAVAQIPDKGYEDIKEMLIPRLHRAGMLVGWHRLSHAPIRVSNANACFVATRFALRQMFEQCMPPSGYAFVSGALVHESAEIARDARLEGPCLVGPRARIERGATVVGPTTLGADTHVEANAIVCRTLLWDRVCIGQDVFLDRCILTHGAAVESEQRLAQRIVHQVRANGRRKFWSRTK